MDDYMVIKSPLKATLQWRYGHVCQQKFFIGVRFNNESAIVLMHQQRDVQAVDGCHMWCDIEIRAACFYSMRVYYVANLYRCNDQNSSIWCECMADESKFI